MGTELKRITEVTKFLLDTGLLFEINRRVLHPLGLALEVSLDGDNATVSAVWDCRNDPEGVTYEEGTFKYGARKYATYMEHHGLKALQSRKEKLGYLEQTE